ncbi:MAG TPA: glyoxalase superfamily protein [Candidatus Acidoferrum sp.]
MQFNRTVPILRIFDAGKAKEFYVGWLGFKIDWEHQFEENTPKYIQVSRGYLVLHWSEHRGDALLARLLAAAPRSSGLS